MLNEIASTYGVHPVAGRAVEKAGAGRIAAPLFADHRARKARAVEEEKSRLYETGGAAEGKVGVVEQTTRQCRVSSGGEWIDRQHRQAPRSRGETRTPTHDRMQGFSMVTACRRASACSAPDVRRGAAFSYARGSSCPQCGRGHDYPAASFHVHHAVPARRPQCGQQLVPGSSALCPRAKNDKFKT